MGESLQEGTIIKWLKSVGEIVERDEMILEISTDKVDTEVPSPNAGKIVELVYGEGDTVEVGTVIAIIETDVNAQVSAPAPAPVAEPVAAPTPIVAEPVAPAPVVTATPVVSGGALTDVVMPKMGESLQEGTVIKWLKKVGETIERDEMILEISTDKVDTEVPSPVAGLLAEIIVPEGETVEVGAVIARISTGGSVSAAPAVATVAPVAVVTPAPVAAPVVATPAPVVGSTMQIPARKGEKFFSPVVKNIAEENKISLEELETVVGTGDGGRITKDDLLKYIATRGTVVPAEIKTVAPIAVSAPAPAPAPKPATPAAAPKATPMTAKAPSYSFGGDDIEVIPMDRIRQLISEHMVYSKHTSAHVTSVAEVDVTNIVRYREKFKDSFEKKEGFKLTYTPFFAKAAIDAIKQFPMVNVSVDGKNIIRHKRINLGMATALPDGNLIVPVIKNSEILNITGIARAIYDLSSRARNKKLLPDEIQGGTFTVTNVGTFGTLFGTPVINQPQCGIFGVGAIKKRPMVKEIDGNDLILVRHMMYVSITYDHRVIDGMLAGQTLAAMVKSLESMNESNIVL